MTDKTTIKPAGCFANYEDYEAQFPKKNMEVSERIDLHIREVDPRKVIVKKFDKYEIFKISFGDSTYNLYFYSFSDLCTFAGAISDKVAEIGQERMDDNSNS